MNFKDLKEQKWFPLTVAICIGILFNYIIMHLTLVSDLLSGLFKICSPLIVAAIIAYLMDPIARFFTREFFYPLFRKEETARKYAIILSALVIICAIALLIIALIPQLAKSITGILSKMDIYEQKILDIAHSLNIDTTLVDELLQTGFDKINELLPNMTTTLLQSTQNLGSGIGNVLIGFILALYFMFSKITIIEWIKAIAHRLLDDESYAVFSSFCKRSNEILLRYVSASILEALLVGFGNCVLMLIFRMPLSILISIIVGVTNLAPTFGPIVGGAIGFLLLFLERPIYGVYFLIFTLVIQTIDGYIVKPKLFGNTLGVSSLWILIAIIIGGKLFGVKGLLIAIPLAAIIQFLLEDYLFPYTRKHPQKESIVSQIKHRLAESRKKSSDSD